MCTPLILVYTCLYCACVCMCPCMCMSLCIPTLIDPYAHAWTKVRAVPGPEPHQKHISVRVYALFSTHKHSCVHVPVRRCTHTPVDTDVHVYVHKMFPRVSMHTPKSCMYVHMSDADTTSHARWGIGLLTLCVHAHTHACVHACVGAHARAHMHTLARKQAYPHGS